MKQVLEIIIVSMLLGVLCCIFLTIQLVKETTALAKSINEIKARPTTPKTPPEPIELNRCNLLSELHKQGVHYPHIVFAQSMIETGNLSSFICKERNNLFGMHNPTVRESKTIAKRGDKYAKFSTWQDAVEDMKLWQAMHELNGQEFTDAEYIAFLRTSGYIAGAAEYYEELILKIKLPKCQD